MRARTVSEYAERRRAFRMPSSTWRLKPYVMKGARIEAVVDSRSAERRFGFETLFLAVHDSSRFEPLQN